ncbi:MAG: complex I NDUFA9 subunit family protein [Sulfurimicrobium sp.]|nr:complex I NDUFA9 subunit family protein [Sulfurimicrobium sp.]MDP2198431.1 complex I NDUFA9 subunit family protein [Sulfurimicrobium sp.]MDP3687987.1 complex I NDUFA9 subunit family protein [Sulfurimicrobium sp.]
MNIKKVCVLGGAGFVGIHLVNKLEMAGYAVRVLTSKRDHAKNVSVLPKVEVVEANIFDPSELNRHFSGMDAVINLVGILREEKPSRVDKPMARRGDFHEVHVELPRKIVHACAASGVKRLLHMSALNADPNASSGYLRSKGLGETIVREAGMQHSENENWYLNGPKFVHGYGLAVTVFRPSVIFGREDSFINMFAGLLKIAPVLPLAGPNAKFQPVFVEDVAQAFVASLNNQATFGQRYDLCGPKVYTLRELVELVAKLTGHNRKIINLSPQLSYLMALMMEWMPGPKLMTRDNYFTMQVDSVCACEFPAVFDVKLRALEAVAPDYLSQSSPYQGFRSAAGR